MTPLQILNQVTSVDRTRPQKKLLKVKEETDVRLSKTTLSVEVAHFTHDALNILHWCGFAQRLSGPPGRLTNHTTHTSSCQRAKSERATHQNMNAARAKWPLHTGSRCVCQPQGCYLLCLFATKPENLNYSVADTPFAPENSL